MFNDFIYLAKGFQMRPKVRSTLSRQFYVPQFPLSLRRKRLVVSGKTEKASIATLMSFFHSIVLFVISNKTWAIKLRCWFSGLFRNPATAYPIFGVLHFTF